MTPKVLNKRTDIIDKDDIYIGRPSKWGNPYHIGKDGSREDVVVKYEQYIRNNPSLMLAAQLELVGKNLVCFCSPQKCHGDVLLKIANGENDLWG
jgi:hypothetical protein